MRTFLCLFLIGLVGFSPVASAGDHELELASAHLDRAESVFTVLGGRMTLNQYRQFDAALDAARILLAGKKGKDAQIVQQRLTDLAGRKIDFILSPPVPAVVHVAGASGGTGTTPAPVTPVVVVPSAPLPDVEADAIRAAEIIEALVAEIEMLKPAEAYSVDAANRIAQLQGELAAAQQKMAAAKAKLAVAITKGERVLSDIRAINARLRAAGIIP